MPATETVRRSDNPLEVNETDGLELPEDYIGYPDGVVVRTPSMTLEMPTGSEQMTSPLGVVFPRHFDGDRNPDLAPDKVSLKKYGEDAEVFRVDV